MGEQESVPAHLQELLEPTASGTDKLLAAWDGLATETKIILWRALQSAGHPGHLRQRIRDCALLDRNGYVRYLAARELTAEKSGEITHSLTADDPSGLVRYAHFEDEFGDIGDGPLTDPGRFCSLPHWARLARVRCLKDGGEEIAAILVHGARELLPSDAITELELAEIAHEFVQSAFVRHRVHEPARLRSDYYGEFLTRKGIEALWRAVPELPEEVAFPLVEHLPEKQLRSSLIPDEVLDAFPPRLFTTLLSRTDVELQELRKRLALDAIQDHAWNMAAAVNLRLTDDEFESVLVDPAEVDENTTKAEPTQGNVAGRLRLLRRLAGQPGLAPVQQLAIADMLRSIPIIGPFDSMGEDGDMAQLEYERAILQVAEQGLSVELDRVRVYRAAQLASDWGADEVEELPEPLQRFHVEVARGDPWGTYRRLRGKGAVGREDIARGLRAYVWLDEIGEEPTALDAD